MAYHFLSVVSALVCLAKGKWIMGVIGFLLWPVALVGALRLAEPRSLWARRIYEDDKMARARTATPAEREAPADPTRPGTTVAGAR